MARIHRRHFESDGNGGFYVSKKFLALSAVCLTLLSAFASIVVYAQTIRYDVTQLQKEHSAFEEQNNRQDAAIMNEEKQQARIQQSLDDLKSDTADIKTQLRSLNHP